MINSFTLPSGMTVHGELAQTLHNMQIHNQRFNPMYDNVGLQRMEEERRRMAEISSRNNSLFKFEPPKFELPKYEPPKFELPKYELPKFDDYLKPWKKW